MQCSVVYDAAPIPHRLNEDTYYCDIQDHRALLMVADGAASRRPVRKLQPLFKAYGENCSSAGYASRIIQQVIAESKSLPPREILLRANDYLRQQIESVYGALTAEALLSQEPHLQELREEPRLIRLVLPVAVATVARIDLACNLLEFAHVGDTQLWLFRQDGGIQLLTTDRMEQHDQAALQLALEIQRATAAKHLADPLNDERVIELNNLNGMYHNYLDVNGKIDLRVGVGVVNGLPEITAYMQTATVELTDIASVLVASDGAIWPAPLPEEEKEKAQRYRKMREIIEADGLAGYLAALRAAEKQDPYCDRYPRFKIHDDATAIYLELTA